jgi:hypothetical protein
VSARSYGDKLRDPKWQRVRLSVMERDGFACRDCGDDKSQLHVHHCFYEKGDPWETGAEFLLTLCESCHEMRGFQESDAKRMLGQILAKIKVREGIGTNDLSLFVESMAGVATATDYDRPMMTSACEWDHQTSIKWYLYALEHPEARKCFEDVTGHHPKWITNPAVDKC